MKTTFVLFSRVKVMRYGKVVNIFPVFFPSAFSFHFEFVKSNLIYKKKSHFDFHSLFFSMRFHKHQNICCTLCIITVHSRIPTKHQCSMLRYTHKKKNAVNKTFQARKSEEIEQVEKRTKKTGKWNCKQKLVYTHSPQENELKIEIWVPSLAEIRCAAFSISS